MGIAKIGTAITTGFVRHKPEICIIGGAVGIIAGGIMGVKATTKVDKVIDEAKYNIECAKESGPAKGKELTKAYIYTGIDLAKIYGPAIIITSVSAYSIFHGTNIFRKRNLALIGACTLLESKLDDYGERVKEMLGEEVEYRVRHGIEKKTVEIVETDEKGKEKKVKKEVEVITAHERPSDTAKFFCESSCFWTKNPEENLIFLKQIEEEVNALFDKQGYIFLNDVYERLDIPKTELGTMVGWVKGYGDDFIDFGIYNLYREGNERFVNGLEPVVLLDFNHDGYILDKIGVPNYE